MQLQMQGSCRAAPPPATRGTSPRRPPTISGSLGIALDRLGESDRVVIDAPHSSGTRRPGRCAASRAATAAAAAGGSQAIHTQRTVARISVEASAARVERARWRPDSRHLRQHMRRLAPHRGAHRPTSQRSPRRASTMAARQPPSSAAHAPPRTTPWRAPAYKPAQPASSKHGISLTAAVLGSSRVTPHHTAACASLQASAARVGRARRRSRSRRPRQRTRRLAPHRGARQPTSQRSPRRASTASA